MLPATGFTNPKYKPGSKTSDGLVVTKLYGESAHFVIYRTKESGVGFQFSHEVSKGAHEAIALMGLLISKIYSECPTRSREILEFQLALSLDSCFRQAAYGQAVDLSPMHQVESAIANSRMIEIKRTYVIYAGGAWLLITIIGLASLWTIAAWQFHLGYFPSLLKGAVCGSAGALLSVLLSCANVNLKNDLIGASNINYQGVVRIIVGCLGGALATAAIDAGQIFPWAKTIEPAKVFFCSAAGFVERMIPDLFLREPAKD